MIKLATITGTDDKTITIYLNNDLRLEASNGDEIKHQDEPYAHWADAIDDIYDVYGNGWDLVISDELPEIPESNRYKTYHNQIIDLNRGRDIHSWVGRDGNTYHISVYRIINEARYVCLKATSAEPSECPMIDDVEHWLDGTGMNEDDFYAAVQGYELWD